MEGEEITLTVEELTGNVASEQSCPLVPPPDVQTKTKLENNLKSVTAKKEFQQKEKELQKKVAALQAEKAELGKKLSQRRENQSKTER